MKIEKFICDNCNKEIDRDEWLYSITGDIVQICASESKGSLELKHGHYCKKCYGEKIKELLEIKDE